MELTSQEFTEIHKKLCEERVRENKEWKDIDYETLRYLSWDLNMPDSMIGEIYGVNKKSVYTKRAKWDLQIRNKIIQDLINEFMAIPVEEQNKYSSTYIGNMETSVASIFEFDKYEERLEKVKSFFSELRIADEVVLKDNKLFSEMELSLGIGNTRHGYACVKNLEIMNKLYKLFVKKEYPAGTYDYNKAKSVFYLTDLRENKTYDVTSVGNGLKAVVTKLENLV